MPRVVPSQVVEFIDRTPTQPRAEYVRLKNVGPAALSAVLALTDEIPDELLTMDTQAYGSLIVAREQIKDVLATWTSDRNAGHSLQSFDFPHHLNPLAQIREVLARCPDESPAPGTSELNFVADLDLRTNLRNDIGAVHRALANGEWKSAPVLAGSAAEALLLWALKQRPSAEISSAITALRGNGGLSSNPDLNLDRWNLYAFIQVAERLGVIRPNTAKQTRLAKDFRNFIHPGVAERLGEKCDRATAFSAVAGMEHVVRDLTP